MRVTLINVDTKGTGMVHYCSQFANELVKRCPVSVILAENIWRDYRAFFDPQIAVRTILPPRRILTPRALTEVLRFLRALGDTNPDVVHFTSNHPWVALFLPLLADRRFFLTLHDAKPHVGETNFIRRLNWFMFKRYAAHFFVHGEAIKAELCAEGIPAAKMTVVPHGNYAFFTRFAKPGVSEEPMVLFFGRILPYKGVQYLLDAAPTIVGAVPEARIVIAGEGNFSPYAHAAKACPNVQVLNQFISEAQVAMLFQRCSVVVLPYVEASQTGIIPIAYSFRKPVIATRVGSIPEVVEDGATGHLVPPRDSVKLAEAVVRLLQDALRRREMGENAYRKMREMLAWDKICETTLKTYERVLGLEARP